MGSLALQLFGSVRAYRAREGDIASVGQKAFALLAYLALNPKQPCTRALAATLLWGDRGEEQAHSSLRQTVWSLRKSFNDENASILISDGDRLTLNSETVTVDVHAFERLSGADTRECLEQARALYVGEFLEGIDVKSEGFEEWLARERLRLHDLAADVMERLSRLYMRSGDWHAALGTAQQLLALDPLHEEGHRILMRIYDRTGRRSLAFRQYRLCESTMRRDLDAAPAPETVRLHAEIRARSGVGIPQAEQIERTAAAEPDRPSFEPAAAPAVVNSAVVADATAVAASTGRAGRGAWLWAVALVAIASAAAGVWWAGFLPTTEMLRPTASTAEAPRLSIVVLPFVNLSNDPDQDYFADGFTDILTTDLSRIPGSFVIARNTAYTYKGKAGDAKQVGRELGVRYLLEGSVQRSSNQIRVNAQLIDAETGSHLWAESFDRERGDLFAIEDEITKRIARTLDFQLINIEAQRAERRGTNADAMDYAMRGNALCNQPPSKDNYRAAAGMYERALQLDEHLPAALTGLATVLESRALDGLSDAREGDLRRAEELVSGVLAADPNSYDAHRVKAQILRAQKHYDEAIVEYETAIALFPMATDARSNLARAKILIGEPAEAIPLLEEALRISPRDPYIGFMHYRLGLANLLLGNTDEAIRWYEKAVLTYNDPADAYAELAAALSLKGEKAGAQAALAEAAKHDPQETTLAYVRKIDPSDRPKFVDLRERTLIEGLRQAGMPE